MQSVRRLIPEATLLVYTADSPTPTTNDSFDLVPAHQVGLSRFLHHAFAHPPVGFCCRLKPCIVLDALERTGAERVLYLDNDIILYRRPVEALEALTKTDFLLTPHILGSVPDGSLPNEAVIRPYGTWNAGMFGVRDCADARVVLKWWDRMMSTPSNIRPESGWDQPWLDFIPSFLSRVTLLRHPGYNVGPWNLAERPITQGPTGWLAGDAPLTAFHFSWFDVENPDAFLRLGSTCNLIPNEALRALGREYATSLLAARRDHETGLDYAYSRFSDGAAILPEHRAAFRDKHWYRVSADSDPFNATWRATLMKDRPHLLHRALHRLRRMMLATP